jgi:alkylation response protein AidB-like acyl-CoA dehydrogenase
MFDLARSSEQDQLVDAVRSMLERECPTDRVRECAETGHDPRLWSRCLGLSLLEMALPGGGATLFDVALVAELLGEFLVPVPLLDAVVATRLLARLGENELLTRALAGDGIPTLAVRPPVEGTLVAVPSGAVADHVVYLDGRTLAVTTDAAPGRPVGNLGGLAVADRATVGSRVLAAGIESGIESGIEAGTEAVELFAGALAEWKALTAARLAGAGRRALRLGIDYAGEREAFGTKVATFQAIAHRLADVATDLDAAQLLAWEAAWSHDGRPAEAAALSSMALILAAEAAATATRDSLHVFGGYGFMLEYDIQLYFRHVKATTLLVGDISRESERLADLLWSGGPA